MSATKTFDLWWEEREREGRGENINESVLISDTQMLHWQVHLWLQYLESMLSSANLFEVPHHGKHVSTGKFIFAVCLEVWSKWGGGGGGGPKKIFGTLYLPIVLFIILLPGRKMQYILMFSCLKI